MFFFFLGVDFWQNFLFYFIFFVQALWFIHRKCFRELKYCHNLMFHYIFTTQVPQWYILLKTNEGNPHMTHPRSERMKYYHWVLCSAKSWMCRQKKYTNILEIKFINQWNPGFGVTQKWSGKTHYRWIQLCCNVLKTGQHKIQYRTIILIIVLFDLPLMPGNAPDEVVDGLMRNLLPILY